MPFNVFSSKGGGGFNPSLSPFQVSVSNHQSGIGEDNFDGKCPCDTGELKYTSSYFFEGDANFPQIIKGGSNAFTVYSGSTLFSKYSFNQVGASGITSYIGQTNQNFDQIDCEKEREAGIMRIYGLNKPIFIKEFLPEGSTDTLKIWLSVCFPTGKDEASAEAEFNAIDKNSTTCIECKERANVPMVAFISCGVGPWPDLVTAKLIDKGAPNKPRLEKRQMAANVPIAEINANGKVLKQYLSSNLMLQDMCIGGIPCRYPISVFCELG